MTRFTLAIVLAALTAACEQPKDAPIPDAPRHPVAERFSLDMDGDGSADSLILYRVDTVTGPGIFTQIRLQLSKAGIHDLVGRWDSARVDEHPFQNNAVASRVVLVGHFARAGILMMLSGEDVGCCAQGITIYRVTERGVEKYFESEQFIFSKPVVVQQDSVTVLERVMGLAEAAGSEDPNALEALSYRPVHAIRLEETARTDTALSRELTTRKLGGFAGLSPREGILAIIGKDSSRYLWDSENGRRFVP